MSKYKILCVFALILVGACLAASASVAQSDEPASTDANVAPGDEPASADKTGPEGEDSASRFGGFYRIRPFGDSITAGYGLGFGCPNQPPNQQPCTQPVECWPPQPIGGGYRAFLVGNPPNKTPIKMVGGRHDNSALWMWQHDQQDHDGYSGCTIPQLMQRAEQSLGADVILVHAGTNDIRFGTTGHQTKENLRHLLIKLLVANPRATILVAQIVPIFENNREPVVRDYNQRIPGLVAEFQRLGFAVRVVDLHTGMNQRDFVDGVHPNFPGYEKMANRWRAALNDLPAPLAASEIPEDSPASKGQ